MKTRQSWVDKDRSRTVLGPEPIPRTVLKQFSDEFRSRCNGKFDVSFTAREDSGEAAGKLKRLEQLERFAEMKILTPADGAKENYKPYLNSLVV